MTEQHTFQPYWASAPGETIRDLLQEGGQSQPGFAAKIGRTQEFVEQLISGAVVVTEEIAQQLESSLGMAAVFWLRREAAYRASLVRCRSFETNEAKKAWIRSLPTRDMIRFGWLPELPNQVDDAADVCLRFFGEPSLSSWQGAYCGEAALAAFRTSQTFDSHAAGLAAWLRQGEIEADAVKCGPWNAFRFSAALLEIRSLTKIKDPAHFLPGLRKICAECGVAAVVVRAPTGCRASGATRFVCPDKALLMLSFRYLSDDHFWFTFFHEAGHLLLHGNADTFLEGVDGDMKTVETEANDFAARALIPAEFENEMLSLRVDAREVVRFATRAGVSPGIVVGQLQHRGRFTRRQLNDLKRRFTWS